THSISTLTKKGKTETIEKEDGTKIKANKPSILEKNLNSGSDTDTYKIFLKDIKTSDKGNFEIIEPGRICNILYKPNEEAKLKILEKITNQYKNKLNNLYIYISPISEEYDDAIKYLIGCLNSIDVSVDNNQGRAIIAELTLTIDEKASKKL